MAEKLEVSWDGCGRYVGEHPCVIGLRAPDTQVPHECSDRHRGECGVFVCQTCERAVPWCFGGDGPDCNDCWIANESDHG